MPLIKFPLTRKRKKFTRVLEMARKISTVLKECIKHDHFHALISMK